MVNHMGLPQLLAIDYSKHPPALDRPLQEPQKSRRWHTPWGWPAGKTMGTSTTNGVSNGKKHLFIGDLPLGHFPDYLRGSRLKSLPTLTHSQTLFTQLITI